MIYFLEDDNSIRELVVYTMNSTGFDAVGFSKPREFWAAMEPVSYTHLVIVNNDSPIDGLTSDQVKAIYTGETTDWSELA